MKLNGELKGGHGMLLKMRCILKGHQYLMAYQEKYKCYYQTSNDVCKFCKRTREKANGKIGVNKAVG